jgi:hypothetical protein
MGVDSVPLIGESLLLMNVYIFVSIVLGSDVCFVFLMEFVVHNNGEMILFYSADSREFSFLVERYLRQQECTFSNMV